jgi:DNA-binding NarL/FixJ family response regulator
MTRLLFLPDDGSPIALYESPLSPTQLLQAAGLPGPLTLLHQGNWLFAAPQTVQLPRLSERQAQVLKGLAEGLTTRQMALRLKLSVRMVSLHIAALKTRLQVQSRPEIILRAKELKIL